MISEVHENILGSQDHLLPLSRIKLMPVKQLVNLSPNGDVAGRITHASQDAFSTVPHHSNLNAQQVNDQPIQRLPLEILQRIFAYTMPPQTKWNLDTPWPRPKQGDEPLTLRRVCRYWNEAAFMQSLWSSVAWSVCVPTKPDSKARLAWIGPFSGLTNGAPMDHFSYEIGSAPLTLTSLEMMGAASRLMANSRAVRVVLPEWHPLGRDEIQMYKDLTADMSHLRVLSWTSPHFIEAVLPPEWRLPWTKLTEAPWEQLTALFLICPMTIDDCIDILGWCPELQTVELNGVLGVQSNDSPRDMKPFRHALTSLKVCSSASVDQLFSVVEFPNLKHLHLYLLYRVGRLQDLRLTWYQLKTIVLECPLDLVDAYQLFRQCHVVTKIEWHWPADMEYYFPSNELIRSHPLELPLLESLTITPSLPDYHVKPLINLLVTAKAQKLARLFAPSLPARFPHSGHLTTIVLTSTPVTIRECLSIIAESSSLHHLDVIVWGRNPTQHMCLKTVAPHLSSFTIRTMLQNLQPLLDCLVLPSLASLRLLSQPHEHGPAPTMSELDWTGTRNYVNGPRQQGILAFLLRTTSGHTLLRNITLQDIDIEEVEMTHILQLADDFKVDTQIKANIINHTTNTSHSLAIYRAY